jgi:hypothetical protein
MPISRKRFSKKRTTKKSVRKNTRKHKKRTPRRKYKKSSKRLRFFGGFGEDGECAICSEPLTDGEVFTTNCNHHFHLACIERWCDGKAMCTCPTCRTSLDPNPNPNPFVPPPPQVVLNYPNLNPDRLYVNPNQFVENVNQWKFRIQFFKFVNNPETGETDRVPVRVQDISEEEIDILEKYFIDQILGLTPNSILFFREQDESNPNGYINLGENNDSVLINEGDMDINTIPPTIVQSVTITRIYDFDV